MLWYLNWVTDITSFQQVIRNCTQIHLLSNPPNPGQLSLKICVQAPSITLVFDTVANEYCIRTQRFSKDTYLSTDTFENPNLYISFFPILFHFKYGILWLFLFLALSLIPISYYYFTLSLLLLITLTTHILLLIGRALVS